MMTALTNMIKMTSTMTRKDLNDLKDHLKMIPWQLEAFSPCFFFYFEPFPLIPLLFLRIDSFCKV